MCRPRQTAARRRKHNGLNLDASADACVHVDGRTHGWVDREQSFLRIPGEETAARRDIEGLDGKEAQASDARRGLGAEIDLIKIVGQGRRALRVVAVHDGE